MDCLPKGVGTSLFIGALLTRTLTHVFVNKWPEGLAAIGLYGKEKHTEQVVWGSM